MEKASGRLGQNCAFRFPASDSFVASAHQRDDLEIHAAYEVPAVSLAVASGPECSVMRSCRYGCSTANQSIGNEAGHAVGRGRGGDWRAGDRGWPEVFSA